MSTPEQPAEIQADRPAERALFRGLFDDAAVFPPALAPLTQAVADYVARQANSYADLIGPLLLPTSAIEEFVQLGRPRHLEVALIGRPGTEPEQVRAALSRLRELPAVTVAGVEIGWSAQWRQVLGRHAPLSIEVPRGAEQERALAELQEHAAGPDLVQAKFRTGSSPGAPAPTSTELATFVRACVDHDLGFKLTGGLHHAMSRTTSGGDDLIGFLNVIAATRWALSHGAEIPEMDSLLSQRDPGVILDIVTRMSEADASVLRAFFTAYGCCGVLDPIGDLVSFALIEEREV